MPTYDTPNSQSTYDVPSNAAYLEILVRGGIGAPGQDGEDLGSSGQVYDPIPGGAAGKTTEIAGRVAVNGGESLPVYVGEAATQTSPGQSPIGDGGAGGSGASIRDIYSADAGDGGPGGAPSAIELPDGSFLAVSEGGGGGGGANGEVGTDTAGGGGGGGGGRGGPGGAAGTGTNNGSPGSDADGSGNGGAGGDGGSNSPGENGGNGGTVTHADLESVSTTTTTSSPIVEITPLYLDPTTGLTVDTVSDTSISLSWDAPTDDRDGHRVLWRLSGESEWTNSSEDLSPSDTDYTISNLLNGQQYEIAVEAFLESKTVIDAS